LPPKPPVPPDIDWGGLTMKGIWMGIGMGLKILWPYLLILLVIWLFKEGIAQGLYRKWKRSRKPNAPGTVTTTSFGGAEMRDARIPVRVELETPDCPKCGVPMILRTAGKGKYAGEQFFGCAHYPKCKQKKHIA
jgi:hypothetical protein